MEPLHFLNRKKSRCESRFARERDRGHVFDVGMEGEWFLTLGQTLDELRRDRCAKLRIFAARHRCVCGASILYDKNEKCLLIGDIISEIEDKVYGSIMMRNIIHVARKLSADEIRGNLSGVDRDHFDNLECFYSKFGFEVKNNKSRDDGKVLLDLRVKNTPRE